MPTILGISGSLRQGSYNRQLLQVAGEMLPGAWRLEEYPAHALAQLPFFNEDLEADPPAPVLALRSAIAEADALLFATVEYNGSISGVTKEAVDWASRPRAQSALQSKPTLVIGSSTGMFGAVWAQADLRRILGTAGAQVVGEELPLGMVASQIEGHRLSDSDLEQQLQQRIDLLVSTVEQNQNTLASSR